MEEIEVKFLEIDPEELEGKIIKLKAEKKFDRIFRRRVFDFPDWRLDKAGAWLRIRDEGDKITMSFKQRLGMGKGNDKGMEESEVTVSDFEETAAIMKRLGMVEKFYEENRRIEYILDGVKIDIDRFPLLRPYVEIEGKSWEEVEKISKKIGMKWEEKIIISTMQIYERNGIKERDYEVLTFEKQVKRGL
jgi:adenylate cyclase class 2